MLIGVISDTHDRLPTFRAALDIFRQHDIKALLHAGDYVAPFAARLIAPAELDVPLYCVYGNNDGEKPGLKSVLPDLVDGPLYIELARRRIVMHHFIDWLGAKDYADCDVIVTGHTHEPVNEMRDGKLFLNPGECCGWVTGRCTAALVDLDQMKARIIDIPQ